MVAKRSLEDISASEDYCFVCGTVLTPTGCCLFCMDKSTIISQDCKESWLRQRALARALGQPNTIPPPQIDQGARQ